MIFKNRYHRTGPLRSSPLRVLYLVLKLRHINLQKVSFVSSLMQSMLFTVFLVQGQRETPGLAPPMQWALKRVEHAPSATGILVHVPMGWPCLLVQCRMSCYVAPHALFTWLTDVSKLLSKMWAGQTLTSWAIMHVSAVAMYAHTWPRCLAAWPLQKKVTFVLLLELQLCLNMLGRRFKSVFSFSFSFPFFLMINYWVWFPYQAGLVCIILCSYNNM